MIYELTSDGGLRMLQGARRSALRGFFVGISRTNEEERTVRQEQKP